jgi:hypothetical protein
MSTTLAKRASRPWRRFLRFSVRGMIVVVLVIGVWLGWIVRSAQIQRDTLKAIRNAGGIVAYDWEWTDGKAVPGGKPWAPWWFVNLIGVDYFCDASGVWLSKSSTATDLAMVKVGRLSQLQILTLDDSLVSDLGLSQLNGLNRLSWLDLGRSTVSDAALMHLKGLTKLSSLNLTETRVSDAGLVHLGRLTNLSELGFEGTPITDAGLASLKGLNDLLGLDIGYTRVSDLGLEHVKRFTKLKWLNLHRTRITDAGLANLAGLKSLLSIDIGDTKKRVLWRARSSHSGYRTPLHPVTIITQAVSSLALWPCRPERR